MGESIEADEVEVEEKSGEAGTVFAVRCPECGEVIHVALLGWWSQACRCGYEWSVEVTARRRKP